MNITNKNSIVPREFVDKLVDILNQKYDEEQHARLTKLRKEFENLCRKNVQILEGKLRRAKSNEEFTLYLDSIEQWYDNQTDLNSVWFWYSDALRRGRTSQGFQQLADALAKQGQ